MQCACAILPSMACPSLQYFSTLSHKRHDFREKNFWTQNVFWFSLHFFPETFLIPITIQRYIIINVYRSSCKVPLLLSDFNKNWILSKAFMKGLKFLNNSSRESRGTKYRQTDIQVDRQTKRRDESPQLLFSILLQHIKKLCVCVCVCVC